jgi:hypothetical protein
MTKELPHLWPLLLLNIVRIVNKNIWYCEKYIIQKSPCGAEEKARYPQGHDLQCYPYLSPPYYKYDYMQQEQQKQGKKPLLGCE